MRRNRTHSFNRSMVELKVNTVIQNALLIICFNRSMVELKDAQRNLLNPPNRGFNRSMVELKVDVCKLIFIEINCFNRSMVELKDRPASW